MYFPSDTLIYRSGQLIGEIEKGNWPQISSLQDRQVSLQDRLMNLANRNNRVALGGALQLPDSVLLAQIDSALTQTGSALVEIELAESKWSQANDQITALKRYLQSSIEMHKGTKSEISQSIECDFKSRKEEWTLVVFDLFPQDNEDGEKNEAAKKNEYPLVTFVCESPFSISVGFFTSWSDFQVMPGTVVNSHVLRIGNGWDVNLSLGTLAEIGGEPGTVLEYTFGPSLEIGKSTWLTFGAHISQGPTMQGGSKIDTSNIEELSTVPTQSSYDVRFGFGISYNKLPL